VGKHPPLRPQEAAGDPERNRMPLISYIPHANGVFTRGMVL
jgi:hypothetical protein